MKQVLVWMPPGKTEGYVVPKCDPVDLPKEGRPDRLWTLYTEDKELESPTLPFHASHRENAFLEDYIHDWNDHDGRLHYGGIGGYGVWLLLEYNNE